MSDINVPIREALKEASHNKIWLCPEEVKDISFRRDPLLEGIECTINTVPERLLDKIVDKHFVEAGTDCYIWRNNYDQYARSEADEKSS